MAIFLSVDAKGETNVYLGTAGVSDNDIVIETNDVSRYNTFMLSSSAGAMDVDVNDGITWIPALSIADLGATTFAPVVVTAANRMYGFRGAYHKIRIRQNGATAVANAVLRCSRPNG